jgi:predicted naringenin-chalcone synthase
MAFRLLSVASLPPAFSLDQQFTAAFAAPRCCETRDQERLLSALYRRTRIKKRSTVLLEETGGLTNDEFFPLPRGASNRGPSTEARMRKYEKFAGKLAVRASREALCRAGVRSSEITHLITVSCTGFYAPGIDYEVVQDLGLDLDVERVQIGFMGCHAALNGIRVADAFGRSQATGKILIVAVELCSLHFQYGWNPDQIVSNSLFADGAGAIVGEHAPGQLGEKGFWTSIAHGTVLVPDTADAMTWRIGDRGYHMTISARLPDLIEEQLRPWVDRWLASRGLTTADIRSWAIHPGGPRILTAAEKALDLPSEATAVSREVLACHGNMSSATLIYLLEKLIDKSAGLPCVALGFGPGLTIEAALFS